MITKKDTGTRRENKKYTKLNVSELSQVSGNNTRDRNRMALNLQPFCSFLLLCNIINHLNIVGCVKKYLKKWPKKEIIEFIKELMMTISYDDFEKESLRDISKTNINELNLILTYFYVKNTDETALAICQYICQKVRNKDEKQLKNDINEKIKELLEKFKSDQNTQESAIQQIIDAGPHPYNEFSDNDMDLQSFDEMFTY